MDHVTGISNKSSNGLGGKTTKYSTSKLTRQQGTPGQDITALREKSKQNRIMTVTFFSCVKSFKMTTATLNTDI